MVQRPSNPPLLHRFPILSNPPSLSWVFPRQPSLSLAGPVGPVNRIGVKKFFSSCPRIFGSAALTTVLFTPKFSDRSWWYAPARACRWKLCRWAQIQWQHPPSLGPSFQLSIWTICSWQQIPGSRLYVRPFDFELRTPSTPRAILGSCPRFMPFLGLTDRLSWSVLTG